MPRNARPDPDLPETSHARDEARVCGVVLAAGRGTRMGGPKGLLEAAGRTLVAHAAGALRAGGCARVLVVVSDGAVRDEAGRWGTPVVVPADPAAQQFDSLREALDDVPAQVQWVAVLPVDCPFVRPDTVTRLIRAAQGTVEAVVPAWRDTDGHPVLISRSLFGRIRRESPAEGLRTLLADAATRVARVPVDDDAVVIDIDTPADAHRLGVRT